jgi:hypothetical protein
MTFLTKVTAVLAISLAMGSAAHAGTILVDTISSPETGIVSRSLNSQSYSQSFVADGSGIGDIELELANSGQSATGSIVITLWTNNAGQPGSQLGSPLYVLPQSAITSTSEAIYDFYNISTTALTSGTTYWIKVSSSGTVATNIVTNTVANIGTSLTNVFGARQDLGICISDDNSCGQTNVAAYSFNADPPPTNTPEPASVMLIGAGLAGLGAVRRRLGKRAA